MSVADIVGVHSRDHICNLRISWLDYEFVVPDIHGFTQEDRTVVQILLLLSLI